ncbi:MAG: hypothetical protein ABIW79_05275 [Gemmatimonas sp.]
MPLVAKPGEGQIVRRRRRAAVPTVKKSFTLHVDIVQALDAAVGEGEADNLSAFVEAAIEEKLRRTQRAKLYAAYRAAAKDKTFMADMNDATARFDVVAADGLGEG